MIFHSYVSLPEGICLGWQLQTMYNVRSSKRKYSKTEAVFNFSPYLVAVVVLANLALWFGTATCSSGWSRSLSSCRESLLLTWRCNDIFPIFCHSIASSSFAKAFSKFSCAHGVRSFLTSYCQPGEDIYERIFFDFGWFRHGYPENCSNFFLIWRT